MATYSSTAFVAGFAGRPETETGEIADFEAGARAPAFCEIGSPCDCGPRGSLADPHPGQQAPEDGNRMICPDKRGDDRANNRAMQNSHATLFVMNRFIVMVPFDQLGSGFYFFAPSSLPFGKLKATFVYVAPLTVICLSTASNWGVVLSQSACASNRQVSPTFSPVALLATG